MPSVSRALPLLNLLLPGAGLLIAGNLVAGLLLLVPTVILIALMLGVLGLFTLAAAVPILGVLALLYAALAGLAGVWWWHLARRRIYDPVQVRALHRTAVTAYLQGRSAEAVVTAHRLVAAAPEEAGTWRFLALLAGDAGDAVLAKRALAKALLIENR